MAHQDDCGHNHQPNPYAPDGLEEVYQGFLDHLYRLMIMSAESHPKITGTFCALQITMMTHRADSDQGERLLLCKALSWEIGRVINIQTPADKAPEFEFIDDDGDAPKDADRLFTGAAVEAFVSAAAFGELDRSVAVLDGVIAEATARDDDPAHYVVGLLTNVMMSIAYTTGRIIRDHQHNDPSFLFTEDDD